MKTIFCKLIKVDVEECPIEAGYSEELYSISENTDCPHQEECIKAFKEIHPCETCLMGNVGDDYCQVCGLIKQHISKEDLEEGNQAAMDTYEIYVGK